MQQQQEQQQQTDFYLITAYDGKRWLDDELAQHTPIPHVRRHLGGRWERASEYHPSIKAYFNGDRRVLVMKFQPGISHDEATKIVRSIREGREDLS